MRSFTGSHRFYARGVLTLALVATESVAPANAQSDPPSAATIAHNAQVGQELPFSDTRDFELADRGFLGTRKDPLIRNKAGRVVWDLSADDFLKGKTPATVNPSLWRQGQLLARNGLFRVTDRVYQVRGFDLANMTFIKGKTGWIVIDTLSSQETAQAAFELLTEKLGKRPVTAIIFTHSHADHFGGAGALLPYAKGAPVLAPEGFLEATVSSSIIPSQAMHRRATYMFGVTLPHGPTGTVSSGIGQGVSAGTQSLIYPTREIKNTDEQITVDGVRMQFQLTPGTEAPSEMNIAFPDLKVIDLAENANSTQHNVLTPRGAEIRNAKDWADGLTATMRLFPYAEVMVTSHAWPRWGKDAITDFLQKHRDYYAYLYDQSVRMMNAGMTGPEIAAKIELPPALAKEWYDRPYYGSLSFNARAVYQYYMGFFDGNPVHLVPLPPQEGGRRYVEALGGSRRVRALAQSAYDKGDYSWAAELLDRAVFADPADRAAAMLLARCYDQLAWQSENAVWRNFYLVGAKELRGGPKPRPSAFGALSNDLPTREMFDMIATRLNPAKVGDLKMKLAFVLPDRKERVGIAIANRVMIHDETSPAGPVDATVTIRRNDLLAVLEGSAAFDSLLASGAASVSGDRASVARFTTLFDPPKQIFGIVTP